MAIPTHKEQFDRTRAVFKSTEVSLSKNLTCLLVTMSTEQLAAVAMWIGDAWQNGVDSTDPRFHTQDERTTDRLNHL
jgi:hypothetical protein